ncbi:Zn(II)2Cys6 transcription factor [Penicillium mononematosum]|uniref:Zn(II)2Cys6 transcription factor n=1 Tax=Penicillium mononematosum TaxID=268346 RepID=UPI00254927D0|nr:Zn(II)2Cys6 transcription factor [Penicillium mononematosum]KAJ6183704.1 Zn(II)2Cys6 transcription factor [Penicillium mononematosum]
MDFNTSSYARSKSRRSHTKSRLGCGNCKRRRIKCDETGPECINCVRHSIKCNYGQSSRRVTPTGPGQNAVVLPRDPNEQTTKGYAFISSSQSAFAVPKRAHREAAVSPSQPSPSSESESTVARSTFQFTASDMVLFHHCLSAEDLKGHIPDQLIRLGFSVHYVLHLLLAVSAFYLKRTSENNRMHCLLQPDFNCGVEAERHLSTAIAQVAATDPHMDQGNSHTLYIASLFIFICSLARGPQPSEYLAFRDDNDTPTLCLFNGMRSILEASKNSGISSGISEVHAPEMQELSPQQARESEQIQNLPSHEIINYNIGASSQYSQPLSNLRILILNTFHPTDPRHSAYCDVFELLRSRYDSILGPVPIAGPELWPQIFSWLYLLPDVAAHDMQQKHPIALLLFSYFAVLLNELDSVWFIRGWPSHIVKAVHTRLGEYHRPFLLWPMNELGLI